MILGGIRANRDSDSTTERGQFHLWVDSNAEVEAKKAEVGSAVNCACTYHTCSLFPSRLACHTPSRHAIASHDTTWLR